jgi:dTDP-4-dehydrorhamnose reductase
MEQGPPEGYQYEITALYNRMEGFPEAVQAQSSAEGVTVHVQSCDLTTESDYSFAKKDVDICVHTAALASPRFCEADPDKANAINVPKSFFQTMANVPIIALSTDQVYDGTKDTEKDGDYKEDTDKPNPLNVYAKTKLEMEKYLQEHHTKAATVLLRSSIILGPKAPFGKAHDTFLHFCQSRDQQETTFFVNEYRTVVSVLHVCRIMDWMILHHRRNLPNNNYEVYHLGGPVRVNRIDMAKAVFHQFQFDTKYLLKTEQTSKNVPLDISMDSRKLQELTGIAHLPATLPELVEYTFSKKRKKEST